MQKTILVTGGSGFIGTKLTQSLLDKGYTVVVADLRKPQIEHTNLSFIKLDVSKDALLSEYDGKIYGIVHLAGKNIFGRWTEGFKKRVYDSRIVSTRNIVNTISKWNIKPQVFMSASAFGVYGNKGEEIVTERSSVGTDFLAHVCEDWEYEAHVAEGVGIRAVQIRTAHVLGKGGLLAPLFLPFKFGLGAWIGKGNAWIPWVHIDDIVAIYVFAIENEVLSGPVNTGAPELVRQKEFMKRFGKAMHKRVLFSIPIFLLRLVYGELALTFDTSVRMNSDMLTKAGFTFKYTHLDDALKQTLV